MNMQRRRLLQAGAAAAITTLAGRTARAESTPLKIGVLNDMNGVFAAYQGPGSLLAAQMALEDAGGRAGGRAVEIISADHQNKPDIGLAIARRWLDEEGVHVIMDVPNSSIALAVSDLVRDRNRALIAVGGGTAELTGARCSPNTIHWDYDTWEISHALGEAITTRGGKTWFTIAADYTFGADLDRNIGEAVRAAGGQILGGVKAPFPTSDFSSYLVQAQSSGAQVLALNNAGGDTATSLKQAAEFGLTKSMQVCGPIYNINVTHGVGLAVAEGVLGVTPFYWDYNDGTRAFSRRFNARDARHAMPNDMQAGVYSATAHLLKVAAGPVEVADGRALVAAMKALPTDDPLFGPGSIRADGRKLQPVYLFTTKSPAQSSGEWDYYTILSTIPAERAYRPLADGHCPLVKS
jgi:branched-chain amino acid transport system substrate-binding protein